MNKKNEKGFSLIELLVVIIIIAIVAAIAIPNLLASRRAANQSSAVANLRTISSAEATYSTTGTGVYGTFAQVSAAGLLDPTWTGTPTKNGYTFTLTANGTSTGFCVGAAAGSASVGDNSYGISHRGVIYQLAGTAAPVCDSTTGAFSTGTVVGS